LSGGYSGRDRDEEQAPFIVEVAQPLDELKTAGAIGVALRWSPLTPPPGASRAVAALCAAHPGPAPVLVEWSDGDGPHPLTPPLRNAERGTGGEVARLRSRSLRVAVDDELLGALRDLLGPEHVHLVRTT